MTTHAILGAAAGLGLAFAVVALTLAVLLMRQNARTTSELRAHRNAHQRTHGRPDPDPEHHGTSPTVQRLADDVTELRDHVIALTAWADEIASLLTPDEPHQAAAEPTRAMHAQHPRPEARP